MINFPNSLLRSAVLATALLASGCVTYLTPGPGAPVGALSRPAGGDTRVPQANFPVRLALARIQAPGYRSYDAQGLGDGAYSVVVQREVEKPEDYDNLRGWPQVLSIAPIGRVALPATLKSFDDLRLAAQNVQADVLFVYTFDTRFGIENNSYKQQHDLTLGVLPGREAQVTSSASGMFIDVDTGFVYGVADGSAIERTSMSKWTKPSAADETRLKAERDAFDALLTQARQTWDNIVVHYADAAQGSDDSSIVQPNLGPALRELSAEKAVAPPANTTKPVTPPAPTTLAVPDNLLEFGHTQPAPHR